MSVYRRKGQTEFSYDFQITGRRFSGRTGCTERRAAETFEASVARPAAQRDVDAATGREEMRAGKRPITIGEAAAMWWDEVGQHHRSAPDTRRLLEGVVSYFGAGRSMETIGDPETAAMVAKLRGRFRPQPKRAARNAKKPRPAAKLVSNGTVNRSLARLQALFGHAENVWKIRFPAPPDFSEHKLGEAKPKPREIPPDVRQALFFDLPDGYLDVAAFALASGKRQSECLLRWDQIDDAAGLIHVEQKGGETHSFPITRAMRAIIERQRGRHPVWVFTFVARGRGGKAGHLTLGERYPITLSGLRSTFNRRARRLGLKRAFHGLRHTRAMTLLRKTGNLKMTQDQLGHSDISTTAKYYAHVLTDELRAAVDLADADDPLFAEPSQKVPQQIPRRTNTER